MTKELIKNLKRISEFEAGGRPQEDWIASNREILMSQIKPRMENDRVADYQAGDRVYYFQYFNNIFRQRLLRPALAVFVVAGMMLGYSATLTVASGSIEGDALYSVKTAQEKVQLVLAFSEEKEAKLHIDFASRRADELDKLAQKDEAVDKKAKKITKTAENLSKEVSSAKEKLNKVGMASVSAAVAIAKEVDSGSLAIEQKISVIKNNLPADVKNQIGDSLDKALGVAKDTGNSALSVIVDKYVNGESDIDSSEVVSRVAERIKTAQQDIAAASAAVSQATSTAGIISAGKASSTMSLTFVVSTSTIENVASMSQQAQEALSQAQNLLDQGNLVSAMEKVVETKDIVIGATSGARAIVSDLQNSEAVSNVKGTSTDINVENSGSSGSSESTSQILIK